MTDAAIGAASSASLPESGKRVTWTELFFDLVFAYAITQVSELLSAQHTPSHVGRALIVFIPVYWTWVGATMHGSLHDVDRPKTRIGIFIVALIGLFMALAVPASFGPDGVLFGASYWAARVVLLVLVRAAYRGTRFNSFVVAAVVSGPLLLVGGFVDENVRVVLWGLAACIDVSVPYLARRRLVGIPFEPAHLAERYGLFVIIALGESVVAIGVSAGHQSVTPTLLSAMAVSFTLTVALWWVYFVYAAAAIRYGLQRADVPIEVIRPVLPYGHLGFVAGIIASATAVGAVIAEPSSHLGFEMAALLFGGVALYLATFGYTRWAMFRTVSGPRLIAASVCVMVVPAAVAVPAGAALLILTVIVVSLNLIEAHLVPPGASWLATHE